MLCCGDTSLRARLGAAALIALTGFGADP